MATEFDAEIAEIRADVEVELAELMAQLPDARAAADEARKAHEAADHRFHNLELRVSRATSHGKVDLMGATARLLAEERARRDRVSGAMVRARKHLENVEYAIGCKHAELAQLDLVRDQPPLQHRPEVVKRTGPQALEETYDTIVMPSAVRAA